MEGRTREALELHILTSLARSQRALARIIGAVADQVEGSDQISQHFTENIKLLSLYQRELTMKICRLQPRKQYFGKPGTPWINTDKAGVYMKRGTSM
jgi:hypothetical protein